MPTDADIARVRTNLANMQAFNDYLYDHGNPLIANAYALLSEQNTDKGMAVVVNMMESAFWAMAAVEGAGPVGAFAANTLCGILNAWTNGAPPPDMAQSFADLIQRFEAASVDVDTQLAVYHDDPAAYWDQTFTYDGQTCTLGDLASGDFPAETDPEFFTLMDPCLYALDQFIWRYILTDGHYQLNEWLPSTDMPTDFDFDSWGNAFYAKHPAYWATSVYHQDTGECGDESCYYLTQWNLATGHGAFSDGSVPDNAANYLFSDLSPGTPNPNTSWDGKGLYARDEVFTAWGLKVVQIWTTTGPTPHDGKLKSGWFRYLRAKQQGHTVLSDLHSQVGPDGIKARILDAVHADPSLRAELANQHLATEAMERILGVPSPAAATFTFVPEGPRHHALVLPWTHKPNQRQDRYSEILDEVRASLNNGADEELWPPGLTLPQAVERLKVEWIMMREYVTERKKD